ncbi:DUF423 domain-containing protein [Maribacter sp.]|nr:DUF423 domain-containing protein [Maribacter sp.]
MNRTIFMTGLVFGVLAVLIGAFGAHGLENLLDARALNTFETGVKYQMYHALFLLVLGSTEKLPATKKKWVYYFVLIGVILFSFSIYLLATNTLTAFDFKSIGFITPIGGAFLIFGWALLAVHSSKHFK